MVAAWTMSNAERQLYLTRERNTQSRRSTVQTLGRPWAERMSTPIWLWSYIFQFRRSAGAQH